MSEPKEKLDGLLRRYYAARHLGAEPAGAVIEDMKKALIDVDFAMAANAERHRLEDVFNARGPCCVISRTHLDGLNLAINGAKP